MTLETDLRTASNTSPATAFFSDTPMGLRDMTGRFSWRYPPQPVQSLDGLGIGGAHHDSLDISYDHMPSQTGSQQSIDMVASICEQGQNPLDVSNDAIGVSRVIMICATPIAHHCKDDRTCGPYTERCSCTIRREYSTSFGDNPGVREVRCVLRIDILIQPLPVCFLDPSARIKLFR